MARKHAEYINLEKRVSVHGRLWTEWTPIGTGNGIADLASMHKVPETVEALRHGTSNVHCKCNGHLAAGPALAATAATCDDALIAITCSHAWQRVPHCPSGRSMINSLHGIPAEGN